MDSGASSKNISITIIILILLITIIFITVYYIIMDNNRNCITIIIIIMSPSIKNTLNSMLFFIYSWFLLRLIIILNLNWIILNLSNIDYLLEWMLTIIIGAFTLWFVLIGSIFLRNHLRFIIFILFLLDLMISKHDLIINRL